MKLLNWKIIQYSLKKGSISPNSAPVMGGFALLHVKQNELKKANEYASATQSLIQRIRDDYKKNCIEAMICEALAMSVLQPFRSLTDRFLQVYKDFKVSFSFVSSSFSKIPELIYHFTSIKLSSWERSRCR